MSVDTHPAHCESVWDYPRPPRLEESGRHIQVVSNGVIVADSRATRRILETSHPPVFYIPPEDVKLEYLTPSARQTFCEWKGYASYFDLDVDGRVVQDAAWFYPEPHLSFRQLREYVAFYPGKMDQCLVDGEQARPESGDFYGGWVTSEIVLDR